MKNVMSMYGRSRRNVEYMRNRWFGVRSMYVDVCSNRERVRRVET